MASKKAKQPEKKYQAHRARQRRRILDAAWKLFDDHGMDRVTMAEITVASGIQPSTMYQYFSGKDEIVWSLVSEVLQEESVRAKQSVNAAPNAFARIAALLDFMAQELVNCPETVRFMAQFDAIYARDWPAERLIALESQVLPEEFQIFPELIREGIADGSLRSDLDPNLTMHAVINTVVGLQRRLASLGKKVEQEYGQPVDRLFREAVRVLLLGLRTAEVPAGRESEEQKAGNGRIRKRFP